MIRFADEADIPRFIEMGRRFHAASPYAGMPFDDAAVADLLRRMMAAEHAAVLCHDHGVIGGALAPLFFSPASVMASELFWWADRDGMSLLVHFEAWAEAMGARGVTMSTLAGSDRLVRILERRGYRPAESAMMRAF